MSANHFLIFPKRTFTFSPETMFALVAAWVNATSLSAISLFQPCLSVAVTWMVLLPVWVSSSAWLAFLPIASFRACSVLLLAAMASAISLSVSRVAGAPPIRSAIAPSVYATSCTYRASQACFSASVTNLCVASWLIIVAGWVGGWV